MEIVKQGFIESQHCAKMSITHMNFKYTIGVMGGRGSFSEEAARHYCAKNNLENYKIDYLITAENVLRSLANGKIDFGIFPIENSNGGIVYESIYAMAKYNFTIESMFEIDVKHCLLVKSKTNFKKINKIVSHQQALRQCRMYLKRKWPDAELEEYCDTAEAAKDLNEGVLPETAAVIAPKICAAMYNLEILEESIQDLKFNFTAFIAARK